MAILGDEFFKERKYPFIVTLLVLLISVTLLIFTNTTNISTFNPFVFYSDVKEQPAPLNPPPPPQDATTTINSKQQELPQNVTNNSTVTEEKGLPQKKDEVIGNEVSVDVRIDWKLCKGPVAVDYIPCLDNFVAIKALKSRRHMEHRERHCPETSVRCLLPLPKGYKVPVPWPKSRDMVRLIVR